MKKQIYINLPVKNLDKSKKFFVELGFKVENNYSDDTAVGIVVEENIFIMLLTRAKFERFTKKNIADSTKTTEVINALSVEDKEEVDKIIEKVIDLGGRETKEPEDHGWMYYRQFEDLDGHLWEIIWIKNESE